MTIGQYWLSKTKPKQVTRNAFKKLLWNKKKYLMKFSTFCLTDGLPETCILAYCSMHNAFVMDYILLTVKSVNLVAAHDGFLCVMEIAYIFHSAYFDYRGAFISTAVWWVEHSWKTSGFSSQYNYSVFAERLNGPVYKKFEILGTIANWQKSTKVSWSSAQSFKPQ